ncbi:hypothetical protein [uncultured Acetobacterium sp.]|uniref:hypothetical protein n=1 Tax=uncultured Acetobacterium sp. TaxID=217139 RepID=UPI0025EB539D|nr:hypothetical protein [uncultured Acetobacterium sp.]
MTENRPYRKGMKKDQVIDILKNMALDEKIDAGIVENLITNYLDINIARINAQKKARTRYVDFAKLLV